MPSSKSYILDSLKYSRPFKGSPLSFAHFPASSSLVLHLEWTEDVSLTFISTYQSLQTVISVCIMYALNSMWDK